MWHIPINATERTLLYAAETLEQFETLLQFFERLGNGENDTWWEKLANDVMISDSADSDSYDDEYDEYYDAPEKETDEPKEIVILEPTTAFSATADESF